MIEEYEKRMAEMKSDDDFMKWLAAYDSDWESEYSGNLLGLHDAFLAGRAVEYQSIQTEADDE